MLLAPLVGAMGTLAIGAHRAAWGFACFCALIAVAAALYAAPGAALLSRFAMAADAVSLSAAPIMAIIGAACTAAALFLDREDTSRGPATLSLALVQLSWYGWMGAVLAQDLATFFVHAQIGWLSACAVSALGAARDRAALNGAFRQVIINGAAGAAFVCGAALAHQAAGASTFAGLAGTETDFTRARAAGLALMIAACVTWAGAAPFAGWTAVAFDRGARHAAILSAGLGAPAALVAIARLSAQSSPSDPGLGSGLSMALAALGAASIVIGAVRAVGAQDLRRLAAYAHAAQVGAALMALAQLDAPGRAAGLMQSSHVSLVALGLLGGGAVLAGRAPLEDLDGLGRRAPIAAAAIAAAALSIIGAPLTFGFLTRWRLIEAGLAHGWWWAAALCIAAALVSVFYAGRLLERIYARTPAQGPGPLRASLSIAHLAATFAIVALGVNAGNLWAACLAAAHALGIAP